MVQEMLTSRAYDQEILIRPVTFDPANRISLNRATSLFVGGPFTPSVLSLRSITSAWMLRLRLAHLATAAHQLAFGLDEDDATSYLARGANVAVRVGVTPSGFTLPTTLPPGWRGNTHVDTVTGADYAYLSVYADATLMRPRAEMRFLLNTGGDDVLSLEGDDVAFMHRLMAGPGLPASAI